MEARNFGFIFLVFILLLSTTPISMSPEGGPPIWIIVNVDQGNVFLLRYRLTFDNADAAGDFLVSILWEHYGNRVENFTLENNPSVYWENGDPVEEAISDNYTTAEGCVVRVTTDGVNLVPEDGTFYVDIWLRAASNGAPHRPMDKHLIYYWLDAIILWEPDPIYLLCYPAEVNVHPWNEGVVIEGKEDAYNVNGTGIGPIAWYGAEDRPPIVVAKRIDDNENKGAVVAACTAATCRNGNWNDPDNPDPHLDDLLDAAFQWMKPGAENIVWYEGYGVYNDSNRCSQLTSALQGRGYNIIVDNSEPVTPAMLGDNDILVIPQLQLGSSSVGGDPTLLPDTNLEAIRTWVEDNHGLLIMDGGDNDNNFCMVQNKILKAFDFDLWFQHDQVNDPNNNWGTNRPIADVDATTAIGGGYHSAPHSRKDTIGLHDVCSLALHKAEFKLENLYKVGLDVALYLENGSKLVVKFYTYGGDNQGEDVIWTGPTPAPVALLENVPHPLGKPLENVILVSTVDNTENVNYTITSFVVHQGDLKDRFFDILGEWFAHPELHDAFKAEVRDILSQWFKAPP